MLAFACSMICVVALVALARWTVCQVRALRTALDGLRKDHHASVVAQGHNERVTRRAVAKTNHELVLLKRDLEEMCLEHGPTIVMSAPPPVES